MIFWMIVIVLTLVVAAMLAVPLMRPQDVHNHTPDVEIYRSQLAEIDRDLDRNLLEPEEAERSRTEIARRLLAADKTADAPVAAGKQHAVLAALVLVFVGVVSIGTYVSIGAPGYGDVPLQARLAASDAMRANRPDQSVMETLAPPPPPPADLPDDYRAAIDRLRDIAPTRPDDLEAWSRLAFHEVELRNYASAAAAQAQVVSIMGDDVRPTDLARLLDLRVVAAGGLVSPQAEEVIRSLLALDDTSTAARYYLGLLYDQTDRPDMAYRLWRDMAENGDPDSFHAASARQMIEDAAFRAGVEYTLPALRGPTAEEIESAQDMSPQDREAMIGSMVAGLADRLAEDGGTAADWARLITAYGVLGNMADARVVWTEGRDVFGANAEAMEILTQAARDAGLVE